MRQRALVASNSSQMRTLYPSQVTLNHVARKQEIQRINKSNMIMLKALRQIKPMVPSVRKHQSDY